ncbi:MAG: AAA family ATPase, partial [Chitinophagales bacterium]
MTNIVKDIKEERLKLSFITLQGFKSINQEGQEISFGDITVLLGANGSGKSNLLSFFSMVEAMLKGSLQSYVAQNGFANTILHYGAKQTPKAAGEIYFSNLKDGFFYGFILSHTIDNTLLLQQEVVQRLKNEKPFSHFISPTYANNKESFLKTRFADMYANNENYKRIYWNGKQLTEVMSDLFRQCQIFQFHDTSKTSKIRSQIYVEDNHYLHNDGGNLAAFLYEMKINNEKYYKRIVRYIKQVMPQFGNFDLQPSKLNK